MKGRIMGKPASSSAFLPISGDANNSWRGPNCVAILDFGICLFLKTASLTLAQSINASSHAAKFFAALCIAEFILVLPETPLSTTLERAQEVLQAIRETDLKYNGQSLGRITASAGTACYLQHETSPLDLLRRADQALYGAKAAGRDQMMTA